MQQEVLQYGGLSLLCQLISSSEPEMVQRRSLFAVSALLRGNLQDQQVSVAVSGTVYTHHQQLKGFICTVYCSYKGFICVYCVDLSGDVPLYSVQEHPPLVEVLHYTTLTWYHDRNTVFNFYQKLLYYLLV